MIQAPTTAEQTLADPETAAAAREEAIRTALTAIRAPLEILRDFPNLSAAERTRLASVALNGEAQLEALLIAPQGQEKVSP